MRIALLQCELEHRHQAPHLAMCLFARDLQNAGHDVHCGLVHPSALDAAGDAASGVDLLVLDSIFPFAMVRRLKERTGATVVIGGHNALQHALRGPADLAIVGPGRQAMTSLAWGADPALIPGLWWKDPEGVLQASPAVPAALESQLLPFDPFLDWDYYGPPRAPGSNLRVPSIVADSGCVWNRSAIGDGGPYAGIAPRLPDVRLGPEATKQIQSTFIAREGGCTFCAFRYTPHERGGAVEAVLAQADVLIERGARGLSLQTEHPLPITAAVLDGLAGRGLDELHIRTIPWLLNRNVALLDEAIAAAERTGIRLVLAQVGFEAFDDATLGIYHKGLSGSENRAAARLLGERTAAHDGFLGTAGHGLVPLHPWSTPEGLRTTLTACREDAPWLLPQLTPASRIELYDEYSPLFWKAQDDGLVQPNPASFGWDWTWVDRRTGEAVAAWGAILEAAVAPEATTAAVVLDGVLHALEHQSNPQDRRKHYLDMRDRARRTKLDIQEWREP